MGQYRRFLSESGQISSVQVRCSAHCTDAAKTVRLQYFAPSALLFPLASMKIAHTYIASARRRISVSYSACFITSLIDISTCFIEVACLFDNAVSATTKSTARSIGARNIQAIHCCRNPDLTVPPSCLIRPENCASISATCRLPVPYTDTSCARPNHF